MRAKPIADTIPSAELVLIPNASHVPQLEVPEIFNRELLKFFERHREWFQTSRGPCAIMVDSLHAPEPCFVANFRHRGST